MIGDWDIMAELKALEYLNEEIDQLASDSGGCRTIAPQVETLLGLAWYFAEKAIREETGCCSTGHHDGKEEGKSCQCCRHFADLRAQAERIGRTL